MKVGFPYIRTWHKHISKVDKDCFKIETYQICEHFTVSIPDSQSISCSATLFHAQLSLRHFRGFLNSEAAIFVLCCYYDCYFCERFVTYKQFEHLLQKKYSISMDVKWRSMMTWMMNDKNVVEWLRTVN